MVLGLAKEKGLPGADQALQSKAAIERLKQHLDPNHSGGQAPKDGPTEALPAFPLSRKSKQTSPVPKIIVAAVGLVGLLWFLSSAYPILAVLLSRLRH